MARRNCASCKYYERSSIARMGWCRHPDLYSLHHNHLVSADDLDCDRGTGDFWESQSSVAAMNEDMAPDLAKNPAIISVTSGGLPVFQVSGSSGYNDDPPSPASGGGSSGGDPPWGNDDRDFNYYEEERYWTDYVRIAAPVLGVIILVVLLWFWIASFLGDDDEDPNDVASGTATIELPTFTSTEEPTIADDATPNAPGVATTPTTGSDATTSAPTTDPGEPTTDPDGEGQVGVYLGATVEVVNTDGAGVNVRADATTTADILTVFLDGTQVEVIDGPVEAEGFTWWQITGNEVAAGWIVQEYLAVVE